MKKTTKESVYFTLPMLGTLYTRYFTVEDGEVVSVDISRPEGREVPYINGVRHNIRPVAYGRYRPMPEYDQAASARNAARNGGVTPARKQRVDARDQHDL